MLRNSCAPCWQLPASPLRTPALEGAPILDVLLMTHHFSPFPPPDFAFAMDSAVPVGAVNRLDKRFQALDVSGRGKLVMDDIEKAPSFPSNPMMREVFAHGFVDKDKPDHNFEPATELDFEHFVLPTRMFTAHVNVKTKIRWVYRVLAGAEPELTFKRMIQVSRTMGVNVSPYEGFGALFEGGKEVVTEEVFVDWLIARLDTEDAKLIFDMDLTDDVPDARRTSLVEDIRANQRRRSDLEYAPTG